MASLQTLQKLYDLCSKAADLVREGEGSTADIPLTELRQRLAAIDTMRFGINNRTINSYRFKNGTIDPSVPVDDIDYLRKTFVNFADKIRTSSTDFYSIDRLIQNANTVSGIHKNAQNQYSLKIPDGIVGIDRFVFELNQNLTSVILPDSLTYIGEGAFRSCENLTSINLPYGIEYISNYTFAYCKNLSSINIPNSVIEIENEAFYQCRSLTSLNFPDSLRVIGIYAFAYCNGLTSINIPSWIQLIDTAPFAYCKNLVSITVDQNNPTYDSRNNCNAIIKTSNNSIIQGCKNTIIPNSVTDIDDSAFRGCTELASINIPDSVTNIDDGAFCGCTKLSSIIIPDSVLSIGAYAFSGCEHLTSVTISDSVNSIGEGAFNYSSITSIHLPSGCQVYSNAFSECSSLTEIYIPNNTNLSDYALWNNHHIDIYFDGTVTECGWGDWTNTINTEYTTVIHCTDGDCEISGGGGSGSGS